MSLLEMRMSDTETPQEKKKLLAEFVSF